MPLQRFRLPKPVLYNRQKLFYLPLPWLRRIIRCAMPACLAQERMRDDAVLATLPEVEITFLDDAEIARVHHEFLQDSTPTDVITFHHGEILISIETAARQSRDHKQLLEHEVALYAIHGLLHLAGWHDEAYEEAQTMAKLQTQILQQAITKVGTLS